MKKYLIFFTFLVTFLILLAGCDLGINKGDDETSGDGGSTEIGGNGTIVFSVANLPDGASIACYLGSEYIGDLSSSNKTISEEVAVGEYNVRSEPRGLDNYQVVPSVEKVTITKGNKTEVSFNITSIPTENLSTLKFILSDSSIKDKAKGIFYKDSKNSDRFIEFSDFTSDTYSVEVLAGEDYSFGYVNGVSGVSINFSPENVLAEAGKTYEITISATETVVPEEKKLPDGIYGKSDYSELWFVDNMRAKAFWFSGSTIKNDDKTISSFEKDASENNLYHINNKEQSLYFLKAAGTYSTSTSIDKSALFFSLLNDKPLMRIRKSNEDKIIWLRQKPLSEGSGVVDIPFCVFINDTVLLARDANNNNNNIDIFYASTDQDEYKKYAGEWSNDEYFGSGIKLTINETNPDVSVTISSKPAYPPDCSFGIDGDEFYYAYYYSAREIYVMGSTKVENADPNGPVGIDFDQDGNLIQLFKKN